MAPSYSLVFLHMTTSSKYLSPIVVIQIEDIGIHGWRHQYS